MLRDARSSREPWLELCVGYRNRSMAGAPMLPARLTADTAAISGAAVPFNMKERSVPGRITVCQESATRSCTAHQATRCLSRGAIEMAHSTPPLLHAITGAGGGG